jgi:hypothetical protein
MKQNIVTLDEADLWREFNEINQKCEEEGWKIHHVFLVHK